MAESKDGVKFARDDFQTENANFMKQLRLKQDFTDVTLVADDGLVRSHKMVLAAGSSVFQDLLGGVLRDQACPCIFLWGVKKKHLELLLDFFYCGETDMAEEDVSFFLELSNRLGMVGLQLGPRNKDENLPEINHEAKLEDEGAIREELFFAHETALNQEAEPKKSLELKPRTKDRKLPEMKEEAQRNEGGDSSEGDQEHSTIKKLFSPGQEAVGTRPCKDQVPKEETHLPNDQMAFREELSLIHETAVKQEKPKDNLKEKRNRARKFLCDECLYRDKDRNGLRRHTQEKHTRREGDFECKRVWCLVKMPTKHDQILHVKECKWFCPVAGCSRKGLYKTRDIEEHKSSHKSRLKRSL